MAKKSKFAVDESAPIDKENSAPNRSTIRSPVRKVMVVKSALRSPTTKAGSLELKFNCMKVPELREELKESGLSTVGKKAALAVVICSGHSGLPKLHRLSVIAT